MIHFITGGERSGKSRFAQQEALRLAERPVYLATARRWDADFENRIGRHQSERTARWQNVEAEKRLSDLNLTGQVVVLDCVTLWLTNIYTDNGYSLEQSLSEAQAEFDCFAGKAAHWLIVSNEIGMGVHANTVVGRKFVELQGWMNQHIAARADVVTLLLSGIPVQIKSSLT